MAIEEMFTSLPTTTSAQMSDIICAVQGYVSPSSLGLSVQESLQQVFNLFQSNIILFNAGNPNGSVAGNTYQLCWDTTNMILYVCTTSGTSSTAVWTKSIQLTAGSNIAISQAGNNITISGTAIPGVSWTNVSGTSQAMVADGGYVAANAGTVTLTLPATAGFGTILYIVGQGSGGIGGWSIAQNSGQAIHIGSSVSTTGVGGSVSSTNTFDSLVLLCTVANTTFVALGAPQSSGLTIV